MKAVTDAAIDDKQDDDDDDDDDNDSSVLLDGFSDFEVEADSCDGDGDSDNDGDADADAESGPDSEPGDLPAFNVPSSNLSFTYSPSIADSAEHVVKEELDHDEAEAVANINEVIVLSPPPSPVPDTEADDKLQQELKELDGVLDKMFPPKGKPQSEPKHPKKRGGWSKHNTSPEEILCLISPVPHCVLNLNANDHRWGSRWKSTFADWTSEFTRASFSRVFDYKSENSWKNALRAVHRQVWTKWLQAADVLKLDDGIEPQTPGEIPDDVLAMLGDTVGRLEPPKQYQRK